MLENGKLVPVTLGLGVAIGSFLIYQWFSSKISRNSKNKKILLQDPDARYSLPLIEKELLTHDSWRYRFELPTEEHVLGLPIGKHIHIIAKIGNEVIRRSYTPVSDDDDHGYIDLVIKVYFRDVHPRFPEGGKMTQYMHTLDIGDSITIKGPVGHLQYLEKGKFLVKKKKTPDPLRKVTVSKVSMIAGGSGIAPILQLIKHILKTPNDNTKLSLLFANQTERDILCQEELEKLQKEHPDQFKLWYTVDTAPAGWRYSVGYVDAKMIQDHLFPPSGDNLVLMCGPRPMNVNACEPNLKKLGYDMNMCFAY